MVDKEEGVAEIVAEGAEKVEKKEEVDVELEMLREERKKKLEAFHKFRKQKENEGHGQYLEVTEEDFLPSVTKPPFAVVHFFHPEFQRCAIMDNVLKVLAKKHFATKFIKINAEKTPFFSHKLKVQVLPTLVAFMEGKSCGRITGFEALGGEDVFPPEALERELGKMGVIQYKPKKTEKDSGNKLSGKKVFTTLGRDEDLFDNDDEDSDFSDMDD